MSRATGVSARLLRYYEERGLLQPTRSPSGQRLYEPDTITRVEQIRALLAAGLSTERIFDLLPCFNSEPEERTSYLLDSLRDERRRLEVTIASLQTVAHSLDAVIIDVAERNASLSSHAESLIRQT
ncbi:MerR family transcriptional regulator [Ilumatobacter nonamiensis]|uniref:MerR family transcriptional regulator n=1 Tax=Ilumatobacter nonamiensis TaxID=467093 RepID=UPI0019D32995|nr:MerR family transcriptional regulator [Ilumatobacter nonamiensis]